MGRYGLTTFHLIDTDNVDSAFSPEVIRPCVPMHSEEHPTSAPFWVRPDSNFGLFCNNDVYQQFRFLSHIIFACSLTVSVANSLAASSRLPLLLVLRKGYCVPFRFLMGITDHFVNGRRRRRYGGSSHWRTINQVTCVSHKRIAVTMQNVPLPSHVSLLLCLYYIYILFQFQYHILKSM